MRRSLHGSGAANVPARFARRRFASRVFGLLSLHCAQCYWSGRVTRVCCLDQASRADGALLWMRWEGNVVRAVGWGDSGEVHWRPGMPWDERQTASRIRIEPTATRGGMMSDDAAPARDSEPPETMAPGPFGESEGE